MYAEDEPQYKVFIGAKKTSCTPRTHQYKANFYMRSRRT
jgi:hypothetical protein